MPAPKNPESTVTGNRVSLDIYSPHLQDWTGHLTVLPETLLTIEHLIEAVTAVITLVTSSLIHHHNHLAIIH